MWEPILAGRAWQWDLTANQYGAITDEDVENNYRRLVVLSVDLIACINACCNRVTEAIETWPQV
jgi:hypothetical protein